MLTGGVRGSPGGRPLTKTSNNVEFPQKEAPDTKGGGVGVLNNEGGEKPSPKLLITELFIIFRRGRGMGTTFSDNKRFS